MDPAPESGADNEMQEPAMSFALICTCDYASPPEPWYKVECSI